MRLEAPQIIRARYRTPLTNPATQTQEGNARMASPNPLELLQSAAAKFKAGQMGEAESLCRKVLQQDAWNIAAMNLLAGVLRQTQRLAEATATMQQVVNLAPNIPEFRVNYGDLLMESQQPDEAEKQYRQAVTLKPKYTKGWFQLGLAAEKAKRKKDAEQFFRRVIELDPCQVGALIRLAEIAREQSRHSDLLRYAEAILRIDPQNMMGRRFRAGSLFNQGHFLEAIQDLRNVLEECPREVALRGALMMSLNYDPDISAAALRQEHELSSSLLFDAITVSVPTRAHLQIDRTPDRVLHIGYVSPDFKEHAVTRFLKPVIAHHDHTRFAIHLYFTEEKPDAETAWYQAHCDAWREILSLSTAQAATLVRQDQIDILIDLAGYTGASRLDVFACRPAPVQVTWLGYPSTTGMKTIDYLLSDHIVDPPDCPSDMTETLWRLPHAFTTFQPPANAPEVAESPARKNGYLTFGSTHGLAKLNNRVLDLWCAVLRSIPDSRLLLYRGALLPATHAAYRERFRQRGIADERLLLEYKLPASGTHLSVYHNMDVLLDCLPWNGHTTTCEALWMGVPTLTLLGDRHAGRMSASMLHAVELDDFIARTPEEFMTTAARCASDLPALAHLRATLRDRMLHSRLMDAAAFTRELESAFLDMWNERCARP
jgi:protein O-GlcNAc transferase